MRIEFTERYFEPPSEAEIDAAEKAALPFPDGIFKYRRIYPRIDDIRHPAEYPGKKNHCLIVMEDWSELVVKGKYDDVCILLDDREKLMLEEGEEGHRE